MVGSGLIVIVMSLNEGPQTPFELATVHLNVLTMGATPGAGEDKPVTDEVGLFGSENVMAEADTSLTITLSKAMVSVPAFTLTLTIISKVDPVNPETEAVDEEKFPVRFPLVGKVVSAPPFSI